MTKSNRLTDYERGIIELAEAWEKAHLMNTGRTKACELALRNFIREHKRGARREAAKLARRAA